MARFGVEVTLVEAARRLLALEEPEAGEVLAEVLRREGVDVRTGVQAQRVQSSDGDPAAVDLSSVGAAADARVALVDERCRVAPGVWAVGDVTGEGAFTHVAMYHANVVIRDILGEEGSPPCYRALPRVTFTDQEVWGRGTDRGAGPRAVHARPCRLHHGGKHRPGLDTQGGQRGGHQGHRGCRSGSSGRCHGDGLSGGEVLGALAVAVHAEVPVDRLISMIYAYPTFHRGIEDALDDLP